MPGYAFNVNHYFNDYKRSSWGFDVKSIAHLINLMRHQWNLHHHGRSFWRTENCNPILYQYFGSHACTSGNCNCAIFCESTNDVYVLQIWSLKRDTVWLKSAFFKCNSGSSDCFLNLMHVSDVMFCAIWCHLYNLKRMKNTHGGVLRLEKLQPKKLQLY